MADSARHPHPLGGLKNPRAVVDWLHLEFTTPRPTQARHLRAALPPEWRPFAEPLGNSKNSCSRWGLRIQDPPPAPVVVRVLRSQGINTDAARVTGFEIAIDWYPRAPAARDVLAQAAHHLLRHLAHPPVGKPRITARGFFRAAARPRDTEQALRDGLTVNVGEPDADHCARFYVKRTDSTQAGAYAPLPDAQHRVRMEVTLRGAMLPITTLQGLATLRFERLARHFHQRVTTIPTTSLAAVMRPEVQQWGKPDDAIKRVGHRRQSSRATIADAWANTRIHDALRGLTRAHRNAGISECTALPNSPSPEGASREKAESPKYLKAVEKNHSTTARTSTTQEAADLVPLIQIDAQAQPLAGVFPAWGFLRISTLGTGGASSQRKKGEFTQRADLVVNPTRNNLVAQKDVKGNARFFTHSGQPAGPQSSTPVTLRL